MASQATNLTFPPGRMVWGSLYKGRDRDFEGRPLEFKSGADKGKPRLAYDFGVAFPKVPGRHWASSEWGKVLWQVGHTVLPNAGQSADFAWKVTDGDSTEVGRRGRPCDKPGYAGHWVVAFSSAFAPRIVNGLSGKFEDLSQVDYVNPGDYIQVAGNVKSNESQGNPGILINHSMVCFSGYGERIHTGLDPAAAGFQAGAVAGAQNTPVGGAIPPAPGAAPAPAAPPVPGAGATPTPPAPAPVAVTPNPSFAPPVPAAPPVPGAPPATAARVMLPAAGGVPYDEFIKAGWTDAQLIQHGKMQA